jgi:Luciferase-like monooxygenase
MLCGSIPMITGVAAGAGWMKVELMGVPFEDRGRLMDEYLAAFKELWTKYKSSCSGKYVRFFDVCSFIPSLCRSHIRRYGSAARVRRRCLVRGSTTALEGGRIDTPVALKENG